MSDANHTLPPASIGVLIMLIISPSTGAFQVQAVHSLVTATNDLHTEMHPKTQPHNMVRDMWRGTMVVRELMAVRAAEACNTTNL